MSPKIVPALLLVASLAAARGADACAMYKPPQARQAETYVADGQKALKQGQPRLALRQFERAMNEPGAPAWVRSQAAYEAGRLHAQLGDRVAARARLELAVSLVPGHADAQLALGKLLAGDDDAAAAQHLQAALAGTIPDRERGTAEAVLAFSLARTGAAKEAEDHLARARALKADAKVIAAAEVALRDAHESVATRM
jgi:tetratricopeptide (TPR) repeat protein